MKQWIGIAIVGAIAIANMVERWDGAAECAHARNEISRDVEHNARQDQHIIAVVKTQRGDMTANRDWVLTFAEQCQDAIAANMVLIDTSADNMTRAAANQAKMIELISAAGSNEARVIKNQEAMSDRIEAIERKHGGYGT